MNFKFLTGPIAGIMLACATTAAAADIIPLPASQKKGPSSFTFPKEATYMVPSYAGDSIANLFSAMLPQLEKATGASIKPTDANSDISLMLDMSIPAEGYIMNVNPAGVVISASRPAGFFYGLQTLRQMLPVNADAPATIEEVTIEDSPRFGWRGFMLDEGRHIFGKDEVKRVLV